MSNVKTDYPTLMEVAGRVFGKATGRKDYETTLGDFIGGFQTITNVSTPNGELVITPQGFRQLARDRLGLPPAIFENSGIRNETKLQILTDLTKNGGYGDDIVKVRVAGSHIEAIVSSDYIFFDNSDLCAALLQLQQETMLPEDVYVMKHDLSPDGRNLHLRLIAPEQWDFKIGENGGSRTFHGNLILSNNELAAGSFRAQPAITRTSCLNSTIGQSLFAVSHRFADRQDFISELSKAVNQIGGYSREMGEVMKHTQHINVESPLLIFERIGEQLGVPKYALSHAIEYWQDNGSRNSLYDIVQSVSAGAREMTVASGRRQANWTNRSVIENKLWATALELQNIVAEGESLESWYLVGELGLKERVARFVEGYASVAPVAEEIAEGIRRMEVN